MSRSELKDLVEELRKNPGEHNTVELYDRAYSTVARLRELGCTVDTLVSTTKTSSTNSRYNLYVFYPAPTNETEALTLNLAEATATLATLQRERTLAEAAYESSRKAANRARARRDRARLAHREHLDLVDAMQSRLNTLNKEESS